MNERIKELALQAGFQWLIGLRRNNPIITGQETTVQEFAELIVRECMDLVKDCYAEPESGQSPYQTVCASTLIEEHFGVAE